MRIRTLIGRFAPEPVRIWGREKIQTLELSMLAVRPLDASNLGGPLNLARIFGHAPASWSEDHAAIKAVYGAVDLEGGVNPGDRRALYYLVRALKCRRVLEIGTHIGASTIYLAMALKAHGLGNLTTVDLRDVNGPDGWWTKVRLPGSPRSMLESLACTEQVRFVISDAGAYLRGATERYDLIFLDGNHEASNVYRELSLALSRLAPRGVVLLHDYYPTGTKMFPQDNIIPGPFLALRRIIRECNAIAVQPFGELPWQTKQGVNITNLAAVVRKS